MKHDGDRGGCDAARGDGDAATQQAGGDGMTADLEAAAALMHAVVGGDAVLRGWLLEKSESTGRGQEGRWSSCWR